MLNPRSGEVVFRLHMIGDRVAQPGIDAGYGVEAAFDGDAVGLFGHRLEVGALDHGGFVHQYARLVGVGGLLHDRFDCFELAHQQGGHAAAGLADLIE